MLPNNILHEQTAQLSWDLRMSWNGKNLIPKPTSPTIQHHCAPPHQNHSWLQCSSGKMIRLVLMPPLIKGCKVIKQRYHSCSCLFNMFLQIWTGAEQTKWINKRASCEEKNKRPNYWIFISTKWEGCTRSQNWWTKYCEAQLSGCLEI